MVRFATFSLFILAFIVSCNQTAENKEVMLAITAPNSEKSSLKVVEVNHFNFEETTLAEATVDTNGVGQLQLALSEPTSAFLTLGEQRFPLFIQPGNDLSIAVEQGEFGNTLSFMGEGSEVNEYVKQLLLLREKHVMANGQPIWFLDPPSFVQKLDSMRIAFDAFHQSFTDSVQLPAPVRESLKKKARLELIFLKDNYILVHYFQDREILKKLKNEASFATYTLPMDAGYLNNSLLRLDYVRALEQHFELNINFPLLAEGAKDGSSLPQLIDKKIRKGNYPPAVKEYFLAINILRNFPKEGSITPAIDSIYNRFSNEYTSSEYMPALASLYQEFSTFAVGEAAPDFTAETPSGELVSLSDLRGKVVYVDVWATWCRPCVAEFPHSVALKKEFEENDQLAFLYVSVDEDKNKWKQFLEKHIELKGIHLIDSESKIMNTYKIMGIPRYILIGKDGKIVDVNAPRPSSENIKEKLESLLMESES